MVNVYVLYAKINFFSTVRMFLLIVLKQKQINGNTYELWIIIN